MEPTPTPLKTLGVSPKLYVAVALAFLTSILGNATLDLPAWVAAVGGALIVAGGVYLAPPAPTYHAEDAPDPELDRSHEGDSL